MMVYYTRWCIRSMLDRVKKVGDGGQVVPEPRNDLTFTYFKAMPLTAAVQIPGDQGGIVEPARQQWSVGASGAAHHRSHRQ